MALKTRVKAGSISNLSDARYFAGMGVEWIGYPISKDTFEQDSKKIKEIAGWLAGVQTIVEIRETSFELDKVERLIEDLHPDYIHLPSTMATKVRSITSLPFFIESDSIAGFEVTSQEDILLYTGIIQGNEGLLKTLSAENSLVISGYEVSENNINSLLSENKPYGIELKGGSEISPGLKSFEEYSAILEVLEEEE